MKRWMDNSFFKGGLVLLVVFGALLLIAPFIGRIGQILHSIETHVSCLSVFEDTNGNGRWDVGEPSIGDLPGLQIQVDDPLGHDGGHFLKEDCRLRPEDQRRDVTLTVILPSEYVATSPVNFRRGLEGKSHWTDIAGGPFVFGVQKAKPKL